MGLDVVDGDYGPFFYTKDQIREVVRYAAERGINAAPIDVPLTCRKRSSASRRETPIARETDKTVMPVWKLLLMKSSPV